MQYVKVFNIKSELQEIKLQDVNLKQWGQESIDNTIITRKICMCYYHEVILQYILILVIDKYRLQNEKPLNEKL